MKILTFPHFCNRNLHINGKFRRDRMNGSGEMSVSHHFQNPNFCYATGFVEALQYWFWNKGLLLNPRKFAKSLNYLKDVSARHQTVPNWTRFCITTSTWVTTYILTYYLSATNDTS